MVEDVEAEALPEISLEVRLEEVVSPLEEIPSVVKLDASQLGEAVVVIPGPERVVYSSCCDDGSRADRTSDESVLATGGGSQESRFESGHEVGMGRRTGWHRVLFQRSALGDWVSSWYRRGG